ARQADVIRQRDERMGALRGLLAQALQPGIDAGFQGETVEARLSEVGRAAEAIMQWDRTMPRRESGAVGYLAPGQPTEWPQVDSPDDQAEEHLADLATRATTALQGIQNLAIAAKPKLQAPSTAEVKEVYALSGNRCAFPGCDVRVVDPANRRVLCDLSHISS